MNMLYFDGIRCKHCLRVSLLRIAKFVWPGEGQNLSEKDIPSTTVACPECKHVYDYVDHELETVPTSAELWAKSTKHPDIFYVRLRCDEQDCDTPLTVSAVRSAETTVAAVMSEAPLWTLHGLKCPKGHLVSQVRVAQ